MGETTIYPPTAPTFVRVRQPLPRKSRRTFSGNPEILLEIARDATGELSGGFRANLDAHAWNFPGNDPDAHPSSMEIHRGRFASEIHGEFVSRKTHFPGNPPGYPQPVRPGGGIFVIAANLPGNSFPIQSPGLWISGIVPGKGGSPAPASAELPGQWAG